MRLKECRSCSGPPRSCSTREENKGQKREEERPQPPIDNEMKGGNAMTDHATRRTKQPAGAGEQAEKGRVNRDKKGKHAAASSATSQGVY